MDAAGTLELQWAQGYNGTSAQYIDAKTLVHSCGSTVKFIDTETKQETVFPTPGEGVGPLAVNSNFGVFGFSEQCPQPRIFVFQYPGFLQQAILKDEKGAQLEYLSISFSAGYHLATYSGVPDHSIAVWNWREGTILCSQSVSHPPPQASLTVSPSNWRQLCLLGEKHLSVWHVEQCNKTFLLLSTKVNLPAEDGTLPERENLNDAPIRQPVHITGANTEIRMTRAAIAGVVGENAENLDVGEDVKPRVKLVSQCWSPGGDIYVGCAGGQLLKIEADTHKVKVLLKPEMGLLSRESSAILPQAAGSLEDLHKGTSLTEGIPEEPAAEESQQEAAEETKLQRGDSVFLPEGLREGSLNCITLHKNGLYAGGEDGTLRLISLASKDSYLSDVYKGSSPITSLGFSADYQHLAVGTSRGSVHMYDPSAPGSAADLLDVHFGDMVGLAPLGPGTKHCVTCREDGEVQVWSVEEPSLVTCIPIGVQATSLVCSPSAEVAAVGTKSGHVYFVDLSNLQSPRIIYRHHMHQGPVLHLMHDREGKVLVSGSDDGYVFVMDPRPSTEFKILGYIAVAGEITSVSVLNEGNSGSGVKIVVTSDPSPQASPQAPATQLVKFDLSDAVLKDPSSVHGSTRCDFTDEGVQKQTWKLSVPCYGACLAPGGLVYALAHNNKRLQRFNLAQANGEDEENNHTLQPDEEYPSHQLPGGTVMLSTHQQWLASCSPDGRVAVRTLQQIERWSEVVAHSFATGGVGWMRFSTDMQYLFTIGSKDGALTCYRWNFSQAGKTEASEAMEFARGHNTKMHSLRRLEGASAATMPEWSMVKTVSHTDSRPDSATQREEKLKSRKEEAMSKDEIFSTPTPTPASDATWLENKIQQAIRLESQQYSDLKKDLRSQIRDMRRTIHSMMAENAERPDIEKLDRSEFNLDTAEQKRMQADADSRVAALREELEFKMLALQYLRDLIKRECWDSMKVKGRNVLAFHTNTDVSNYPLRERTKVEMDEVARVTRIRKIEIAELVAWKEISKTEAAFAVSRTPGPDDQFPDDASVLSDFDNNARKEVVELTTKASTGQKTSQEEELLDDEEGAEGKEAPSVTGSLAVDYGGDNEFYYSQFDLHTREQKINQIVLLKDAIYRMKEAFNKQFESVSQMKQQEMVRIKERNARITKILSDLDQAEEAWQPALTIDEQPEKLLVVEDSEVKVEKYVSPEEQKVIDQQKKKEEERRLKEQGDNARERGLVDMMGGVLEVKKEDELKQDVPKPGFMAEGKPEAEWTEEEKKAVVDYEKKVKELNEEREKYRKNLEAELKKLQTQNAEGSASFDEALGQLFKRKVKTEMVINQEELKIVRMELLLLAEEELACREEELYRLLDVKKTAKVEAAARQQEARAAVEHFREEYENIVAEDKVMDRAFKKDFADVPAHLQDPLYKAFKRRPRVQRFRTQLDPATAAANPFADRPPSARVSLHASQSLYTALDEFDGPANIPDGIEPYVWQRLCETRRHKVEKEQQVKQKALTLAEMNAFLQKRTEEDDRLMDEIDDLITLQNKLREDKMRWMLNLEVQFLLKQGQVEVDSGPFIHDYSDSILLHRGVIEDLNSNIKTLGDAKLQIMVESKDFRKGIHQLEWERRRMQMQKSDLDTKARDIQMFRMTKDLQVYLGDEDHSAMTAHQISVLEQTIASQTKNHEKRVEEYESQLKELKRTIRRMEEQNRGLDKELEELNVSVFERKHINEVNADVRSDAAAEKRMADIVQRRKLVDLAKAQAQEVAVLRAEVERLRMRTFPALVQVEH
ncbi:PREDICTED: cilia- and flagella-associated protein 43-like isoform X1 [Branchiostoma belcheri]|uniref:Cilia- and flagella-associated protein 43-like isoform X1 n=1 Tax=Branchiostoma belcheri TaxID=7741 RepID=A0A6P5ADP3_BRABE|nr:PREDICTED: cilia- and flagella-associated protein 43-like isoform X1 [Branchiostoma belcheri]